jgi:hypothetical protein
VKSETVAHGRLGSNVSDFKATPALAGRPLFLRSGRNLHCIESVQTAGARKTTVTTEHIMKTKVLLLTLALGASTCLLTAQDRNPPRDGQRPPGREGGPGGPGGLGQRPAMPIIEALDVNKDGTIDADEIGKASESLKKLDKNGDGKLTPDEYRPQRPGGPGRPGGEGRPQRPPPEK